MEHYLADSLALNQTKGVESEKWNSSSSFEMNKPSSGFDCHICLDSVQDPVVTLCGHLYCWPCIYKWINIKSNISSSEMLEPLEAPQCPVCKSEISESTLVPLYVLNSTSNHSVANDEEKDLTNPIPGRPRGLSHDVAVPSSNHSVFPRQLQNHDILTTRPYGAEFNFSSPPTDQTMNHAGSTTYHPVISMFSELLCAHRGGRFGGRSQQPLLLRSNSGASYSVAAMSNARDRRQVVQADRSLSRLSFFLCCCFVLCLLLL